jgi:hypothetical protein
MELKYKIWHIDGYAGNNEYDGPSDYNIHKDFILNDTYTKEDVIEMFCNQYKNKREIVVGKCFLVANGAVTYKNKELL